MSFLTLAAAAALSAPLPVTTSQRRPAKFPSEFAAAGKSAAAIIELVVAPQGKVVQCRILQTYGDESFARKFCRYVNVRYWASARDGNEAPVYGVVKTLLRMTLPGTPQGDELADLTQGPDLELDVSELPKAANEALDVKVSLWVDASGSATQCEPRPEQNVPAVYLKLACEQARSLIKFDSVTIQGKPLPGFAIEQKIRFVIPPKP